MSNTNGDIMKQPIDDIVWIEVDKLKANDYNPNIVLTKELNLLKFSILKNGWIQPILIDRNYEIIDGYHRATLVKQDKKLKIFTKGKVPCSILDVDEVDRMLLTIRINRAKGNHIAYKMSDVIHKLVNDYGVSIDRICQEIGATKKEVELLLEDNVFTLFDFDEESKYSNAWIPKR